MKVRNGFVSNSSSSSFIILKPTEDEITNKLIEEFFKKEFGYDKEEVSKYNFHEKILDKLGNKGILKCISVEYGGEEAILAMAEFFEAKIVDVEGL